MVWSGLGVSMDRPRCRQIRFISYLNRTLICGVTTYRKGSERTETDQNGPMKIPKTDFYGYRNGSERTSVGTETDRNRRQLIPKRTSMGSRKGRVGYDRNDPNKVMYVLVGK